MRAVVDPGVLVSAALNPNGSPARLVDAARTGRLVLVVSEHLIAELDDVLARERIASRLDAAALARLRQVLAEAPRSDDPPAVPVSRDANDDYLVALARHSGADALISGDGDLLSLTDLAPPVLSRRRGRYRPRHGLRPARGRSSRN